MQAFLDNCTANNITISRNLPLAPLCGFNTGNNAEYFVAPRSKEALGLILALAKDAGLAITVLGGGSNVLVPDTMLKGLTISTIGLSTLQLESENIVHISAGTSVRAAAVQLASMGKRGLDFLYGMPGTIGGALWMNARCYGKEISDVLVSASGFTLDAEPWTYEFVQEDFSYKKSPFQNMNFLKNRQEKGSKNTTSSTATTVHINSNYSKLSETQKSFSAPQGIITDCRIRLKDDIEANIWNDMLDHEMDRHNKGHFIAPCAGSVFKNNYEFKAPSGQLLDQLDWRNKTYKGAMVNPFHANIIINAGNAQSKDIYALSLQMQQSVFDAFQYTLEHEVILLGEREQWKN